MCARGVRLEISFPGELAIASTGAPRKHTQGPVLPMEPGKNLDGVGH